MVDDTKLRTLSLFSGIGGIELGLRRWCKTVCYCEIDPYAVGVLIKNMGQGNLDVAPVWSDVTTFGQSEIDQIGPIDCITGGFPCQDISCAGKGAGIVKGETRSGLFYEIIRIVRLARPRYVFLENVPALLARGMDTVLTELAESGYDARWKVLSAAELGALHGRPRAYILAHINCNRGSDSIREIKGITITKGANEPRWWRKFTANRLDSSVRSKIDVGKLLESELAGRLDGVSDQLDRIRCLGNAVIPQCAEKAFELLMERQPSWN